MYFFSDSNGGGPLFVKISVQGSSEYCHVVDVTFQLFKFKTTFIFNH